MRRDVTAAVGSRSGLRERGLQRSCGEVCARPARGGSVVYRALLNEYPKKLDQSSPGMSTTEQTHGRPLSLGAAAKLALDDSIEWVPAELDRVSLALSVKVAPARPAKMKGSEK